MQEQAQFCQIQANLYYLLKPLILKAVDVTVIKIYENNIPQFFQTNSYRDGNELRRVAKPIVQKTIRLDEDKALNLHKKNRFTLIWIK